MQQDQINNSAYMAAVKQAGREAANSDKMTHYACEEAAKKYGVTYNQVRYAMFDIINNTKKTEANRAAWIQRNGSASGFDPYAELS